MSRLMQFLVRAYFPLVARHTLIDGPAAHSAGTPAAPAAANGETPHTAIAVAPRRRTRRDDDRQVTTLAA